MLLAQFQQLENSPVLCILYETLSRTVGPWPGALALGLAERGTEWTGS